jgi:hypothetical protein
MEDSYQLPHAFVGSVIEEAIETTLLRRVISARVYRSNKC